MKTRQHQDNPAKTPYITNATKETRQDESQLRAKDGPGLPWPENVFMSHDCESLQSLPSPPLSLSQMWRRNLERKSLCFLHGSFQWSTPWRYARRYTLYCSWPEIQWPIFLGHYLKCRPSQAFCEAQSRRPKVLVALYLYIWWHGPRAWLQA
jgi:hypothetical protein